jgi:hypothetical protein
MKLCSLQIYHLVGSKDSMYMSFEGSKRSPWLYLYT